MIKDVDKRASWTTHEGKSTERGKAFDPTEDDSSDPPTEAVNRQSVPIGRPVNSHDYDHLKERARYESPLPGGNAQEDTRDRNATDGGGGDDDG